MHLEVSLWGHDRVKFWRGPCPRDPGTGRTGPSQGPPLVGTGTHPVKGTVRAGAGGWDSRGRSFQNTHYEDDVLGVAETSQEELGKCSKYTN